MMRAEQTGHFFDESVLMRVMYSSDNRTSGVRYNALTPKLALQLAAPHTWAASVFPSLFGILYCIYRSFGISAIEAALLLSACVLMQAAVNTFKRTPFFCTRASTRIRSGTWPSPFSGRRL